MPIDIATSMEVILNPPAGETLSPRRFPVVGPSSDEAGAALVLYAGDFADGGNVALESVPANDAGTYAGSFSVTVSGKELSGQFSAPFCPSIL